MGMTLPADIKKRINFLFTSAEDQQEVEKLLLSLWTIPLNVGEEQLARSILVLSDGKLASIRNLFSSNFSGDPRDVIMNAEAKMNNPGHYFVDPFSDS
jgi:hypothetical protein